MISVSNKIIVALDVDSMDDAERLAFLLTKKVGMFKIGLEFFTKFGIDGVREISQYNPIMLDLKLHDIPNTVARTCKVISDMNIAFTTIHTAGSSKMIQQAVEQAFPTLVFGVTVLTSMDEVDHIKTCVSPNILRATLDRAKLAIENGCHGIVASPKELKHLRDILPNQLIITPGIRLSNEKDDQKRTNTPYQAIKDGANYLVIGRPITQAPDPLKAVENISLDIIKALKEIN